MKKTIIAYAFLPMWIAGAVAYQCGFENVAGSIWMLQVVLGFVFIWFAYLKPKIKSPSSLVVALCLLTSVLCPLLSDAQTLVFSNQTITVAAENLSLEAVEYHPFSVSTNTVQEWVADTQITTNGLFDTPPNAIITNSVQSQIDVEVVTTNTAHWVADVEFSLPRGHQWELNGFAVEIERFKTRIRVDVNPLAVQSVFGPAAAGLEFAATHGKYQPQGIVRDGFLGIAAATLAAGGAQ